MKLNRNDIEREIDEAIADYSAPARQGSHTKAFIRPPYSSRYRDHATEGYRRGSGAGKKKEEESTL